MDYILLKYSDHLLIIGPSHTDFHASEPSPREHVPTRDARSRASSSDDLARSERRKPSSAQDTSLAGTQLTRPLKTRPLKTRPLVDATIIQERFHGRIICYPYPTPTPL